eukprot:TRINITY_DN396_c0_g1_i1.p1 TRINITY_DN396_c0_g1~~TRINITY_DN396_c0_g1_i1.p1  ORF type:complete len:244 (-),score=80.60 TRINITY_DN396_c0_g1_i1:38-715(-)
MSKTLEKLPPVVEKLKTIRRAIVWSRPPKDDDLVVGDITEREYGYSGKLGIDSFKSFADLVYSIAAADGHLSAEEEKYIESRINILSGSRVDEAEFKQTMEYVANSAKDAKDGKYKGKDLTQLIETHVTNAVGLGNDATIARPSSKACLFDAVMAAQVDGFAGAERRAAADAAKKFNIPDQEFAFIVHCSELETLVERYTSLETDAAFAKDVEALSSEVQKFFSK